MMKPMESWRAGSGKQLRQQFYERLQGPTKECSCKTHQPDHLQRSLQSSRWRRTTKSERDCRAERADVSRGSCWQSSENGLLAGEGGGR